MNPLRALFPKQYAVMDGGTGTALQDELGADVSSSMWSAGLLIRDSRPLTALAKAWEEAGADIVETCTYQATIDGILAELDPKMADPTLALGILRQAVALTRNALARPHETKVMLSLGPYGATLRPGREYTGRYDPPFGHDTSLHPHSSSQEPGIIPDDANLYALDPETSLAQFHIMRLLSFAAHEETWRNIDLVGFETIPNLEEARAIRRCWASLQDQLDALYGATDFIAASSADPIEASATMDVAKWWRKPFVISFVFPDQGQFPSPASGHRPSLPDVLDAALSVKPPNGTAIMSTVSSTSIYSIPDGIGINCTKPHHVAGILTTWTNHLMSAYPTTSSSVSPWLFLYPDGGQTYDVNQRRWTTEDVPSPDEWARGVVFIGHDALQTGVWDGVVVGGCCKAGTRAIKALRQECSKQFGTAVASFRNKLASSP